MATYGQPGNHEPPTDPWTDETMPVQPASGPPQQPAYPPPPVAPPAYQPPAAPAPPAYQPASAYPPVSPPAGYGQQPYQPQPPAAQPYQPQQQYAAQPEYQQPYAQQPAYGQPAYGQPGYDQQWQGAPPVKQRSAVLPVMLTLLIVVVLAGIGVGVYLYANRTTTVAQFIPQENTCVVTDGKPVPQTGLKASDCATPGSYTVVKLVHQVSDKAQCNGVANVTSIFTFTASGATGESYTACLKQN